MHTTTNYHILYPNPCLDFAFTLITTHLNPEKPAEAYKLARVLDASLAAIVNNTTLNYMELIADCNAFKHEAIQKICSGEFSPLECAIAGFAVGHLSTLIHLHPA
jgi:hypothetical protein